MYLQQLKRDAAFKIGYVKGVPFVTRGYTKGVPFCQKCYIQKVINPETANNKNDYGIYMAI